MHTFLEKIKRGLEARGQAKKAPEPKVQQPLKWEYDFFREYLLAISRGDNYLVLAGEYPREIELSGDWHTVLERARRDTNVDLKERGSLVAINVSRRAVFVKNVPYLGTDVEVSHKVYLRARKDASEKVGADVIVAHLHSHPYSPYNLALMNEGKFRNSFSPTDLYNLVSTTDRSILEVLVEGTENLFAFRARDSKPVISHKEAIGVNRFHQFWLTHYGFRVFPEDLHRVDSSGTDHNLWDVNVGIAERYGLVIYKGPAKGNLRRVVPE